MINLAYNMLAIFQNWKSIYAFACEHDLQHHNVLPWYMEGYQPYMTFVDEGIQPQQSFYVPKCVLVHIRIKDEVGAVKLV